MQPCLVQKPSDPASFTDGAASLLVKPVQSSVTAEPLLKTLTPKTARPGSSLSGASGNANEQVPSDQQADAAPTDPGGEDASHDDQAADSLHAAKIRHVIVAVSGDAKIDRTVHRVALKVAEVTPVHLHYVSVVTQVTDPAAYGALAAGAPTAVPPVPDSEHLKVAIDDRHKALSVLVADDLPADTHGIDVRTGLVDDEILAAADENGASLIVVGSGDHSWFQGILSADLARQVTSKANCPVLVVPERITL